MTREQFLNDLKAALADMQEEEREGVLSYYAEMIDDRMEAGMTEEAAVKAMEPVQEIASRVLEEAGVPAGNKQKAADDKRQEIRRPASAIRELRVQAENKRVTVEAGEDEEIVLRYMIGSNDIFQLHEDDGVLTLEHKMRPVSSFINEKSGEGFSLESILSGVGKFISSLGERIVSDGGVFNYEAPENEIEITLPKTMLAQLTVSTSNSRIAVGDITFAQPLRLSTSNAYIKLDDVNCAQKITCATSNSRIALDDVNARSARLTTSNGRITLSDLYIREELEAVNSNGSVTVKNSTAEGRVSLSSSNGRIELEAVSAPDYTLKTSNGMVGGTLKGNAAEYTITSSTSNGNNLLGNRAGGDKRLNVHTSNAPITLKFEE